MKSSPPGGAGGRFFATPGGWRPPGWGVPLRCWPRHSFPFASSHSLGLSPLRPGTTSSSWPALTSTDLGGELLAVPRTDPGEEHLIEPEGVHLPEPVSLLARTSSTGLHMDGQREAHL